MAEFQGDGPEAIAALEARIAATEPGQPLARSAEDFERYVAESVAANRYRYTLALQAEAEREAGAAMAFAAAQQAEPEPELSPTAPPPPPPPVSRKAAGTPQSPDTH